MKKTLLACGIAALLAINPLATALPIANLHVDAATEVNFDQGSMSDEEYVKEVIKQFSDLELIHMEALFEGDGNPYTSDIDFNTMAMVSVTEGEFGGTIYSYDDGSSAKDTQSEIDLMKSIYFDNTKELEEIAKEIEGKFMVTEYPELKGQITKTKDGLLEVVDKLEEFSKDGKIVSAYTAAEKISESEGGADLAEFYGKNATIKQGVIIDAEAKTMTLETIIDIDENEMEETSEEEDGLGLSFSDMVADSTSRVVLTPGTEKVPSLEELDTITKEEIDKMLEDKGIEVLF